MGILTTILNQIKSFLLQTIGRLIASDHFSTKFPVSIKGVILAGDKILLLKNERNEWDLPGGKLEKGEKVTNCLEREIKEETGLDVQVGNPLSTWVKRILNQVDVVMIAYLCNIVNDVHTLKASYEHKGIAYFKKSELNSLNINVDILNVILMAFEVQKKTASKPKNFQ